MADEAYGSENALTKRELEVLALMAEGLSHKDAAEKLFLSPKTVRTHLQNIYAKLQVKNKIEAINKVR
jgi:DNA-binding NarL/FixJ family response regulator